MRVFENDLVKGLKNVLIGATHFNAQENNSKIAHAIKKGREMAIILHSFLQKRKAIRLPRRTQLQIITENIRLILEAIDF